MDPAYLQTSLHARELYDQTPGGIAEKKAEEEAKPARRAGEGRRH